MNERFDDHYWMQQALTYAKQAEQLGEIPVGAILVKDNQLVAAGYNRSITDNDPSAHAEMMAVRKGGKGLNNYRLIDCTLYVTLEPCSMCATIISDFFKRRRAQIKAAKKAARNSNEL